MADLYETTSGVPLAEWDQVQRIWQEMWNSGQQFVPCVGWSRREWRFITYRFLQVVGPWLLTGLLTLRHQGEGPWVDETVRLVTVTLDGMAHDILRVNFRALRRGECQPMVTQSSTHNQSSNWMAARGSTTIIPVAMPRRV